MIEYAAFSDESRHTEGRYRTIAAVSLPAKLVVSLSDRFKELLQLGRRRELKWGRVGERRPTYDADRAIAAIDFLLTQIANGMRADVLTWDTEDERHDVTQRDDHANYERMFFHLHRTLMKRRGSESRWHVRPDEQVNIDWNTIKQCLNSDGTWRRDRDSISLSAELRSLIPTVRTLRQVDSATTPLSQLADLLAGMAAYTRTEAAFVRKQIHNAPEQGDLFQVPDSSAPTARDRGRFSVISHLYYRCRSERLGVSLREHGYLCTRDPTMPINFWHYTPQHSRDKAPTREQSTGGQK